LIFSAAYAGPLVGGVDTLQNFTKALNAAQTLNASYVVQPVGGSSTAYTLSLGKPNLARIDTSTQLIVADGTNIVTYDKTKKTYYKRPETAQELTKLVSGNDFYIWAGFFDANVNSRCSAVHEGGTKTRNGVTYNVVSFHLPSSRPTTATYYLGQDDNLLHQAEFDVSSSSSQDITVYQTKSVKLGGKVDNTLFAFVPPDGSRELTEAEINAGKWYTSIDEALDAAKAANKLVFVFFEADW
jgi:outer membrane lipoprotein-sorting protein